MIDKIKKFIKKPWLLVVWPKIGAITRFVPDKFYLECFYRANFNKKPDLKNPKGFNEKLQWLKLHDRKPEYSGMVDKLSAKKYVSGIIGSEYIIKTLGVYERFDDIDFERLPERFVLKCTHDSAGLVICRNKAEFDMEKARKKLEKCLCRNFYYSGREWPYKNIKPRIIAEEFMEDTILKELRDYKFFTFGGVPSVMHLVSNRQNTEEETYGDFYDMDFNHIDLTMGHRNSPYEIKKPNNFELMKEFAKKLSKDTVHLRVDFYEVNGCLYFGELTFYQDSGFADIKPEYWDKKLGDLIKIP